MKKITLPIQDVINLVQFLDTIEVADGKEFRVAGNIAVDLEKAVADFKKKEDDLQEKIKEELKPAKKDAQEMRKKCLLITDEKAREREEARINGLYNVIIEQIEERHQKNIDEIKKMSEKKVSVTLGNDKYDFLKEKFEKLATKNEKGLRWSSNKKAAEILDALDSFESVKES